MNSQQIGDVSPLSPVPVLRRRLARGVGPWLGVALLSLAAWILQTEFQTYAFGDVVGHLRGIPTSDLLLGLCLTVLGYLALTGYDALAFRHVESPLAYRRVALSSFIANAFSHNIGLSVFGGGAVRHRILPAWGVTADDIARILAFLLLTLWLGFLGLGGVFLTIWPLPLASQISPQATSRPLGWLLIALTLGCLLFSGLRREPLRVRGFRFDLPKSPRTLAAQFAVSSVGWLLAAGVLYTVLPSASGLTFPVFVGAFLLAQALGLISQVPGGLGVFEAAMVLFTRPWLEGDELMAALIAYRVLYYLLPLTVAIGMLALYEIRQRRAALERTGVWVHGWMAELVPRWMAVTIFLAGALLLFSGATPELPERLGWLRRTLPVPWIEVSKLLGSVIGVALLVLANALRQRLDVGYFGAMSLLTAGAVVSLVKGLNWEEAILLLIMALVLLPCRRFFYRRSSLLAQPLSRSWWLGVAAVAVGAFLTLDLAYRNVQYSNDLWWSFGAGAQAPRSLRALLVAGVALLAVGALRLLRPAPPPPDPPTTEELDLAHGIASKAPRTTGYLALLGDKNLLFHADGKAFLQYGLSDRTWIAMGDPVGPEENQEDLAWQFRELADQHGGKTVFYQVSEQALPIYLDLGLGLRKVGEEGRVALQDFSLEGSARKDLRQSLNRATREGCTFEILPAAEVASHLDELEVISNAWLKAKNTREKRFSLGFFDRTYLARLPVALVRLEGRIVAFANIWPSDAKIELTIDLMRYDESAPKAVMEYLITQIMLWGQQEGYQHFSLGMAPLSGLEQRRLAPLWNRFGALVFTHGEHFYNFQGLRAFKEKFAPEWAPRYLAAPEGLSTPLVLTRVASLVAGGVKGILTK